jgi:site-specific recombinase XerD
MNFSVAYHPSIRASSSPYRLLDEQGAEVTWANDFLDAAHQLQRSPRSLRIYAFDLLHFARWWSRQSLPAISALTASGLQDYLRHQLDHQPPPSATTVNHRLGVVRCLYRFHCGQSIPGESRFQRSYTTQSPLGYGRRGRALSHGLRLTEPRRVMLPLSWEQADSFWNSFHSYRDVAIVGLMLLVGLRSCEVLALEITDLQLTDGQMLVRGKGNKQRILPLPQEIIDTLQVYLHLERPQNGSSALFVCLKGRSRGLPLSAAGLRSLFRYHRAGTHIPQANPHRFRHTFGADMVRGGISLPALQHLMGHAHIRTTMLYVQLAPQDIWKQYRDALEKRKRRPPKP